MTLVSLAALCIAGLAPFARSFAWGVPLQMFSFAMSLRAAIGSAIFTFFAGALATLVLPTQMAAALGAAVGGLLMLLAARRDRHQRGVALLAWRLTRPETQQRARQILGVRLAKMAKHLPAAEYADLALFASVPLTAIGAWDEAGNHLAAIDTSALDKTAGARANQALATVRLQAGDLEGAQAAIDSVERPADEAVERWLAAMEALLLAVQGAADEALARANAAPADDAALAATYDVVRAHAFACKGKDARARKALASVRERAGDGGLERAMRPIGPASDLAREMLS